MIESEPCCADEKPFRDDAGIGTRRQTPGGFFNHLLLFRLESDDLCETLVTELGVGLEADGVSHQSIRFWKSVEQGSGDIASAGVRVQTRPQAPILLCLSGKPHAA